MSEHRNELETGSTLPTPVQEGGYPGVRDVLHTAGNIDRAIGTGLKTAGKFAARVAQKHPAATAGAIAGAVLGHKASQVVDKNLPDGQHLSRGAKARWIGSGAVAGAATGAGIGLADRVFHKRAVEAVEKVIEALNDSFSRINESGGVDLYGNYQKDAKKPAEDEFVTYYANRPPEVHAHLAGSIKRAKILTNSPRSEYQPMGTDIAAHMTTGEIVPLGHVNSSGFHYLDTGLKPGRIPESLFLERINGKLSTKEALIVSPLATMKLAGPASLSAQGEGREARRRGAARFSPYSKDSEEDHQWLDAYDAAYEGNVKSTAEMGNRVAESTRGGMLIRNAGLRKAGFYKNDIPKRQQGVIKEAKAEGDGDGGLTILVEEMTVGEYELEVKRPGKFQGAKRYVPYFYEASLRQGADDDFSYSGTYGFMFKVRPEDAGIFPELESKLGQPLYFYRGLDGFVEEVSASIWRQMAEEMNSVEESFSSFVQEKVAIMEGALRGRNWMQDVRAKKGCAS